MKISGMDRLRKKRDKDIANRRLRIEQLEDKRLLAIVWANEFGANGFDTYDANEVYAREIVSRSMDDWNSVILDQNFDGDNNVNTGLDFQLSVNAIDFATLGSPGTRGDAGVTGVIGNDVPIAE